MSTRLSRHALRIALITTAVVAGLMVALCVAIDVIVAQTLRSSATTRLTTELTQLAQRRGGPNLEEPDVDDPVLVWNVNSAGAIVASTPGAPALPASAVNASAPSESRIAGADVLVAGVAIPTGRLVGAVSVGNESKALTALTITEAVVGPALLVVVFAGAFVVGRQTAGPIERARRRQLEFTADASHELRTPLAVIEAETTLALANLEADGADDATLRRVADETHRMRSIVEDLLWLARFDALPPDPVTEPVDVTTAAEVGVQRFVPIAEHASLHLENRSDGATLALVDAPADWIDRLIGVLLDNACRYTPPNGTVSIAAARERDHVRLTVSDTGPGIPMERRARIFERFRRGTSEGDGAGLGLAIGNAIVVATRGRWQIADVPGGGTSVGVVWPLSRTRLVDGFHP
ncbi:MAG TPA: HAMP domain-containing sensor histidine kinase [Candidatus Saccharimonadales bacterium]|nr:HAMP domain-containing sensor histidine kinase [Candidatus Saccharimonadales bacterium]